MTQASTKPQKRAQADRAETFADDLGDDAAGRGAQREADADFGRAVRDDVRDHAVDADGGEREEQRSEDREHPRRDAAQEQVLVDVFGQRADVEDRKRRIDGLQRAPHLAADRRLAAWPRAQVHLPCMDGRSRYDR